MTDCAVLRIEKKAMMLALHREHDGPVAAVLVVVRDVKVAIDLAIVSVAILSAPTCDDDAVVARVEYPVVAVDNGRDIWNSTRPDATADRAVSRRVVPIEHAADMGDALARVVQPCQMRPIMA